MRNTWPNFMPGMREGDLTMIDPCPVRLAGLYPLYGRNYRLNSYTMKTEICQHEDAGNTKGCDVYREICRAIKKIAASG